MLGFGRPRRSTRQNLHFPCCTSTRRWKFREMYEFRDMRAREVGMQLIVDVNPEAVERGINPFVHGSAVHTDIWKTQGLKQALDKHAFDLAFGGARRDEEKSRAKERIFSFRSAQHRWDPKLQRPELWRLYNARKTKAKHPRVSAVQLDRARRLGIYPPRAHPHRAACISPRSARPSSATAHSSWSTMNGCRCMPSSNLRLKKVRFRTLGCYPLTGAMESEADNTDQDHPGDAARDDVRAPRARH